MNGITIEERNGRFRVLATFPNNVVAQLGTFATPGEAIAYATEAVLAREGAPS